MTAVRWPRTESHGPLPPDGPRPADEAGAGDESGAGDTDAGGESIAGQPGSAAGPGGFQQEHGEHGASPAADDLGVVAPGEVPGAAGRALAGPDDVGVVAP